MGKGNRQRELARARAMRQQARRAELKRRRKWQALVAAGTVLVVGAVFTGLAVGGVFSSDDNKKSASPTPSPSPSTTCTYTPNTTEDTGGKSPGVPPVKPTVTGTLNISIVTSRGPLSATLDATKAPCTVNAFKHLIDTKFYDGNSCSRVTTQPNFAVLQCGDPTGTGKGGPGYSFNDENLTGATYPRGTIAMANGGANTNGSQFFLVDKDSQLPASYTPFGTITAGLGNLDKIITAGTSDSDGDGPPTKPVTLTSVTAVS